MKSALQSVAAVVLYLSAYWPVSASAVVPGSKITVTFEGLTQRTREIIIPGGYDGLDFYSSFLTAGKAVYKHDSGFQAVIRGGVACVLPQFNDLGSIKPSNRGSLISIKSGHFAAFGGGGRVITFNAYKAGELVGMMNVNIETVDTPIKFDKTFSNIDQFQIIGEVAFDNLVVKFAEQEDQ